MKKEFKEYLSKYNWSLVMRLVLIIIFLYIILWYMDYGSDESPNTTRDYIFSSNGKQVEISVKSIRCTTSRTPYTIYNLEDGSTIVVKDSMVIWKHNDSVDTYSDFSIVAKGDMEE